MTPKNIVKKLTVLVFLRSTLPQLLNYYPEITTLMKQKSHRRLENIELLFDTFPLILCFCGLLIFSGNMAWTNIIYEYLKFRSNAFSAIFFLKPYVYPCFPLAPFLYLSTDYLPLSNIFSIPCSTLPWLIPHLLI